jgi:hypothetical protein
MNDIEMECVNEGDLTRKQLDLQQVPKVDTKPKPLLKSKALKWHMPIIGEVPMSKFLIPLYLLYFFCSVFHPRVWRDL